MIHVKLNEVLDAYEVRTGTSEKGDWQCITVKENEGKGRKKATIWVENCPTSIYSGGKFLVRKITEVRMTSKEFPKGSGKWTDVTNITAMIEPVNVGAVGINPGYNTSFSELEDSGELPF